MRQSELFTRVARAFPKDEEALNAKLLIRAGFVDKTMAGVYTFLPLGLRVIHKIENIIREEMNGIGGQEILMPALHPKELWQTTNRWEGFDALLKVTSRFDTQYALGPTHEEVVTPLIQKFVSSYQDLPFAAYQIQTKFRDEARSKSGLLRGREFRMKDLYSFHRNSEDLLAYYERAKEAYGRVFKRLGLEALVVEASGGTFSKYSHEFQVLHPSGEDVVFHCACGFARNKEIIEPELQNLSVGEVGTCPSCNKKTLHVSAGIEVGNIFQLNTKFSEPFGLKYKDESGEDQIVYMGCYGIGVSRAMGAIAEVYGSEQGVRWPESVTPFRVHLVALNGASADHVYEELTTQGVEVLYDDRDLSAGEKFAESDFIGTPWRFVVSPKTGDKVEVLKRGEKEPEIMDAKDSLKVLK